MTDTTAGRARTDGGDLDLARLRARILTDVELMIEAAGRAGWATPVPGLAWDVRTVTRHTGAVHRWAADIVRRAPPTNETGGSHAFHPGDVGDDAWAGWLRDGAAELVDALAAADDTLECFTFIPGVPPRRFWTHRQLHETSIHRVDLELAAGGPVSTFPKDLAQDGLRELVGGFATERGFATARAGRLLLACTDGPSWSVQFGGDRTVTVAGVPADLAADAVVRGSGDELYRWAWNRPTPEVVESGDPATIASWRGVQVR